MDEQTFQREYMGIPRPVMLGPLQVVVTDTLPDGKKWNINDHIPWWEEWGPDDSLPKICMPPVVWEFLEDHFRLNTREGWQRLESCGKGHFFQVLLPHARDRAIRYLADKSYVQFVAHQLKGRLKRFEGVPLTQTVQREVQMIVQDYLRAITEVLELDRWLPEPLIVVAYDPCDPTKLLASIKYSEPQNPMQRTTLERLMSDFNGVVGTIVNTQQPRPTQVHYRVGEYEGTRSSHQTETDIAEPEYNEETCITAGELRAMGLPIPEKIPDCAWIPRNSWGVDEVEAEQAVLDPSVLVCNLKMHFYEPFRWVHLELEVQVPPSEDGR